MWLACLVLVAAAATAQAADNYTVFNAAWECAAETEGQDKVLTGTVDGKPGTINCSEVFNGESFKSPKTIADACTKTPGTSGTGSCGNDGTTGKAGCILSVKSDPTSVFCINAEYEGTGDQETEGTTRVHQATSKGVFASTSSNGQPGDPLDYCNTNAYDFSAKGYVNFDAAYCGTLPAPFAATTAPPRGCECSGCKKLKDRDGNDGEMTAGPCKYNGPNYDNLCTDVNKITQQCPEVPDDKTTVEDCCATTTPATTTPAGNSTDCYQDKFCDESKAGKTSGPCLMTLPAAGALGADLRLCLPYQDVATKKCQSRATRCEDTCDQSAASASCNQITTPAVITVSTTKPVDTTQCTDCYADSSGECATIYPVEGSGKNYCLAYITGTETFPITMLDTGYPDQTSGPRCLQGTKRCGEWSTSTSTTSTSVSTSTTTSTSTSAPPRYDPGLPELQDALNNLITSWEFEEGCGKTQGFEAESIAANIVANTAKKAKALAFLNEGVIRNYMTSGYYIRDQRLLFENYFGTEKVGAAPQERVCAEYNQTCTCNGLTRFQSVPATSWGTYRCHKSTFEKASKDIIFEPALSNKNMQCFCRADAEVQADYEVQKVARMFELAREVGATRRCDKMGAKLVTNATKNRQTLFLGYSNGPGPNNNWNREGPALNEGCAKKRGACGTLLPGSMSAYTVNLFNTTQPGLDCTRKNTKKALTCEKISFAKTEELERLFNEIFRNPAMGTKWENKALVDQERETNYNPEYASKAGLDSTNLQLQENRNFKTNYEVANAALLQAKKANVVELDLKFETLGAAANFARGTRVAYRTESCQKGGIKNLLGMCECSSAVFAGELITAGPPPPPTTAPPATTKTAAPTQCAGDYEGPIADRKTEKKDQLKCDGKTAAKSGACVGMSLKQCTDKCTSDKLCKAFSFMTEKKSCFLSTSSITSTLQDTSAKLSATWNHFVKSKECSERTTEATSPVTTAQATTESPLDGVIVGSECAEGIKTAAIEKKCQEKCDQQHECEGYLLYWEPTDTIGHCQQALANKAGNNPFDVLPQCDDQYNTKCAKCSTHDSCQPICDNTNATSPESCFACLPCLHPLVKQEQCTGLYSLAGNDPIEPVVSCVLLQNVCDDDTKDCLNDGNVTGGIPANITRGISKLKTLNSANKYQQYPTATSTATSSVSSTATSTVSTTETMTGTSTDTSSGTSTATTSGESTDTTSGTSTVTSSGTATEVSTQTTSQTTTMTTTTTATSTVSETVTVTVTTTATSTVTTNGPDYNYRVVYESFEGESAGRRFGNAFSKKDRIFYLRYDVNDQDKGMQNRDFVLGMCKSRCEEERTCMGVFLWKQDHHVPKNKRKHKNRPTGYSCVGLGAGTVFGNFFSYSNFATELAQASALNSTLRHENNPMISKIFKEDDGVLTSAANVPGCTGEGCVIQGFTGESVSLAKRISCGDECTYYTGACIHRATGFCMDEVPGTAQCLQGFDHCNQEYFCNWAGCPKKK